MSENPDERLEAMLRSRRVEPARHDLAARIVLKAQNLPQVQDISLWQAVRQWCAEFHLPKPGYVLASALVLGMVLGFNIAPDNASDSDEGSASIQNYLTADEVLL